MALAEVIKWNQVPSSGARVHHAYSEELHDFDHGG